MDVVCFSFDCNIYDDGSSNCTTIDPRYTKTTTYKPTFKPSVPSIGPTTTKARPTKQITTPKTTAKPTTAKPSPTEPITTPKPTTVPPSPSKSSVATTPKTYQTTVTLPRVVTSDVIYTTTNIRTSSLPMGHKVTSPGTPAVGPSVYIPCSVVGFVVVVVLLASIAIVRRYRNRKRSLEDGQLLDADTICDLQLEYPQSIFNEERQYVQPTALSSNDNPVLSDAPLDDDIDDTVERAAPVYRDNIMFERTTFGTQRERDTNKDKVV
ncbi:platelet glycoprotein Ib alpha chain-like isoform X1 [Pecten maximus]|uniref:platelet glycoprotein Ib alpha chain-like isoform X1 n=1 Tax=Pecten maximus TaxID=6579 RepID=UPI0014586F06|nr:platelet glycoprotein Ib alpha chain-like isoform X1 [Pecten maximus]